MADPLSIASGVAGLLSFGIQVTQTLVEFYSAYKSQTPALAKIILNLESLSSILRSLDDAVQKRQSQTDALLQEIDKAAAGCREIIEELWDECQKFQKDSTLSLKGRIQVAGRRAIYPFRTSTLQKLEEDIGEIRDSLSLALNVLQIRNQTGLEDGISELKILVQQTNTIQISATIRDWLKAPDATIDHNLACEKRHTSTGLWLVNGQKFQNWLIEPNSFLWLNGFAGCGKSILCSTAIQIVQRDRQHQPGAGIGFFYFSFNDEAKTDCSGMLRALLLQLSAQLEGGETALQELYGLYKSGTPPVKVLLDSLRQTVCKFNSTYILLDALDESPRDDKREYVLDAIEKIRQWDLPTLHLLATSRNEIDIRNSLETTSCQDIPMRNPETNMDIQNFISYQLSNDPKFRRWKSRHDEIQEKLIEKAQGVFRYVECQLLVLKRARIRNELDKCLRSLPRDLDEAYERILCSIDEGYIEEVRLLLTLLCVSDRPVTMEQLIDALTIDVGASELQLDRDGRSFSENDVLDICLGLIETAVIEDEYSEETTTIVRIAHFSVQEYLESDRISQQDAAKFRIQKETTHTKLAQICLVYLLDPSLSIGNLDETKLHMFPFAHFAARQWFLSYSNSGERKIEIESLILKLFKDQPESFATWVLLDDMNYRCSSVPNFDHHIPSPLYYTALLGLENILHAFIASWAEETTIQAAFNAQGGEYGNALQAASYSGHEKVVQILLDHDADVNAQGGRWANALQTASYHGHGNVVQILVDHGAGVNAQGDEKYSNALQAASYEGHENVAQILVDHGADVNAQGGYSGNALQAASYSGHEKVVHILLDHGADINAQGGYYGNALQAAACGGHKEVVQTLLDHGADVNAQGGYSGNALQAASYSGHEKVVHILLDHGADINAQGGYYGNALQAAACGGHKEVVQTLLDCSADINTQEGQYGNALQAASYSGHEKVVQILLDRGADVNAQGPFRSALQAASMEGHEDVVQILLDHGADVNALGPFGNALQAAASSDSALFDFRIPDREKVVQILLDHGADVNAQGGYYGNALQAAASFKYQLYERAPFSHYESVIKILLDHGADVNAQGGYFGNSLQAAAYRGSTMGVQILLDHGADADAQGGRYGSALQAAISFNANTFEGEQLPDREMLIQILLDHGTDVNAQGGKYGNALQAASCRGHEKVVQILLDRGADVNAQGGKYDSALEAAFWEEHEVVVQLLLDNGADDKAIRLIESEEIGS
ncbi:NACHT nucleoside triphosphatase [Penicillium fimorum]|uniref:NACHT nucleoside triphosphatase n=1 Tax=Penicillium fimorum TaxID=1882269 RepID=A0A9X0CBN7_9EURO|nr:NACHT nucleoside triphosphatase [Penicillium fimorum]